EVKLERKSGATATWGQVAALPAGTAAYRNVGLAANTAYAYRVRACNTAGCSAYSNEATGRTAAAPTPPAAPAELTATATSDTEIRLAWQDRSTNEMEIGLQ